MSIRPIDFQVMIPKTVDVSRIQANEQQQSLAALQSKTQSIEKQSEENLKQVNSGKEPYKVEIREDKERNGREQKQEHRQNQPEEKENGKKTTIYDKRITGSKIDIRL